MHKILDIDELSQQKWLEMEQDVTWTIYKKTMTAMMSFPDGQFLHGFKWKTENVLVWEQRSWCQTNIDGTVLWECDHTVPRFIDVISTAIKMTNRKKERERKELSVDTLNHMIRYKLPNLQKIKYCKNAVDGMCSLNHRILTDFKIFHDFPFTP